MTTITDTIRLNAVKHLANGKNLAFVAAALRITEEQARQIGQDHGYPDTDKLSWAVDVLKGKVDQAQAVPQGTPQQVAAARPPAVHAPLVTRPRPAASQVAEPDRDAAGSIDQLLARATQSDSKRLQAKAAKIRELVDDLRERVNAQAADEAEQKRKAAEAEAARREVAELEAKLREARAKLGGSIPAKSSLGPSAATIRAWAAENGVECAPSGRVPGAVRDAYAAAHAGHAA